jgi:preprotein translocase subunit SecD
VVLSETEKQASDDRTVRQSLEIIRRRVDEVGTREPTIQREGGNRILIQVPGIGSAEELKIILGKTAKLTFQQVLQRTSNKDLTATAGQVLLPSLDEPGTYYLLAAEAVVSGDDLIDAQPSFDESGTPAVAFKFNTSGARAFGEFTTLHVNEQFAIVLDNEVISAPVIREPIPGGSGIINGTFSVEEATNLSVLLRAGALPAELTVIEERTIGPELGQDSIDAGRRAALIGMALVATYMILSYARFGAFAVAALSINMVLLIAILSAIGATLTLPGIAGIVLTMGMAVDGNVLIFERIREELREGKHPARAIELGFSRAFSAIMDSNVTAIITGLIMFWLGSGPVRGFAVTLIIGIITSMFTAVYVTRLIVVMWMARKRPKELVV